MFYVKHDILFQKRKKIIFLKAGLAGSYVYRAEKDRTNSSPAICFSCCSIIFLTGIHSKPPHIEGADVAVHRHSMFFSYLDVRTILAVRYFAALKKRRFLQI